MRVPDDTHADRPRSALPALVWIVLFYSALTPSDANAQWQPNGVPLSTATGNQLASQIISDGAGGAIVTWGDQRSAILSDDDIYAQHVVASGAVDPDWPTNGRAVCSANGLQSNPQMVSDGAGGAIVTWQDQRSGTSVDNADIYAQHVLASGVVAWPVDGVALCDVTWDQGKPQIVSDLAGGAIVAWLDRRTYPQWKIYAQRVLATGVVDPSWPTNGQILGPSLFGYGDPQIAPDGVGGAIVTWSNCCRSRSSVELSTWPVIPVPVPALV